MWGMKWHMLVTGADMFIFLKNTSVGINVKKAKWDRALPSLCWWTDRYESFKLFHWQRCQVNAMRLPSCAQQALVVAWQKKLWAFWAAFPCVQHSLEWSDSICGGVWHRGQSSSSIRAAVKSPHTWCTFSKLSVHWSLLKVQKAVTFLSFYCNSY